MNIDQITFAGLKKMAQMPADTFDGLIGMAFPQLAVGGVKTFMEYAIEQGQTSPSFSFYMNGNESAIIFGGVNQSLADGEFHYHAVTGSGYWSVNAKAINFNGQALEEGLFTAIVDSGTSTLVLPQQVAEDIAEVLGLSLSDEFECSAAENWPSIGFVIGEQQYEVPASAYVLELDGVCSLGIMADDGILPSEYDIILGDVFLRNYYTSFDLENEQIGFAPINLNP